VTEFLTKPEILESAKRHVLASLDELSSQAPKSRKKNLSHPRGRPSGTATRKENQ
jgi:hypothetical protein